MGKQKIQKNKKKGQNLEKQKTKILIKKMNERILEDA